MSYKLTYASMYNEFFSENLASITRSSNKGKIQTALTLC